ncbi:glycosyltransferase family 4 protein [Candidatus Bathyarchaeota archaeon]|nr:glycosyltransferase family 4 protein [Candidatus Bathyarchaeota archaeon]
MRILWLSYYYLPHVGGGTWGTYHLSLQLSKRGHKIQLIVPNIKHKLSLPWESSLSLEKSNPSKIHRTPMIGIPRILGPLLSSSFMFCAGLRLGKGADVIVSQHHPHTFLTPIAVFLGRILKVPVIIRADDVYREMGLDLIVKVGNTFNEYFIKYARTFLVVCSEQKEILLSRLNTASSCPIFLSHNGVNLSEFGDVPKKEDARKTLGIQNEEKIVLFVGRYSGLEYGIEVVLEALPIILLKEPNTILILVGEELGPRLHSMINSLGISKNVRVYGSKTHKEIVRFIVSSDLCIGTFTETMTIPLKVLEYMACGKPVVTGVKSLSKDLLFDESNFLIVPTRPESVSEAAIKVLQNEEYARKLGSNGKRLVSKFTWDNVGADLERLLVKTLEGEI